MGRGVAQGAGLPQPGYSKPLWEASPLGDPTAGQDRSPRGLASHNNMSGPPGPLWEASPLGDLNVRDDQSPRGLASYGIVRRQGVPDYRLSVFANHYEI